VIVDRVTKIVVEHRYGVGYGPRPIVDHVLFLTVLRNSGAAFGLFQNFTAGFLAVSLVVMAASTPRIVITTRSSTSVKPPWVWRCLLYTSPSPRD